MKKIFVTGTDTDVGKTLVSTLVCLAFSKMTDTGYFKPVQAGKPRDLDFIKNILGSRVHYIPSLYDLKVPASPDRSAKLEEIEISIPPILSDLQSQRFGVEVVEGAGGLMVPLNSREKIIDLIERSHIPCLLVTSTRLGTINHTLLSVEALKQRNIYCAGLVLSGEEDPGLKELLEEKTGLPVLFSVPDFESLNFEVLNSFVENSEGLKAWADSFLGEAPLGNDLDLEAMDKEFVWHPFTQHGIVKKHPLVTGGRGSYLHFGDRKVLDGISSWWVNLFGHCHPILSSAVKDQVDKIEHVIFAGMTHEPAIQLSRSLVECAQKRGAPLSRAFFSDNGSTSVEVALKMAWQFQGQKGNSRKKRFLAFSGSYHGDTLGAMSVGERRGFNEVFTPLMFDVDYVDPFNTEELEKAFQHRGEEYAAVIVEPMVQGASGMRMYGAGVLDRLQELAKSSKTLVVCDEVFTGFYRTGKMFAFEHSSLKPDLLCLSKGITGGYLPLAVTLASDELFKSFESSDMRKGFLHGHSYTANPVACAVANASLELLQKEETIEKIKCIELWTKKELDRLSQEKFIFRTRQLGTIGAMELNDEDPNYFKGDFSYRFNQAALKKGVLLRPLGGTVYSLPPYCIEEEELKRIYQVIPEIMKEEFL